MGAAGRLGAARGRGERGRLREGSRRSSSDGLVGLRVQALTLRWLGRGGRWCWRMEEDADQSGQQRSVC